MPNYKKVVRDTIRTVVAHASTGFNPQLSAIAATYGVSAFSIDWTLPSNNFAMSYVDEEEIDVSSLVTFPAALLYTSSAVNDKLVKAKKFSGQVDAHLDFFLRYRALTDAETADNDITNEQAGADTESIADAVEDAALECLEAGRAAMTAAGIRMVSYRVERSPVRVYGDGPGQRVAIQLKINLEAN